MALKYKDVKQFIEIDSKSGCKLLSEKYINSTTKMLFQCKCGNKFTTTYETFKYDNKRKCSECSKYTRHNIDSVKKMIERTSDCILLSNEYRHVNSKLRLLCKCGEEFETTLNNFKYRNQKQCPQCGYKKGAEKNKLTYKEVKEYIEINSGSGCKLLSKAYNRAHDKLKVLCKCGSAFEVSYKEFKFGAKQQCNDCSAKIMQEKMSLNYDDVKHYIEVDSNSGCRLLSDAYTNNRTKLKVKCKCGDVFYVDFDKFKNRKKQQCNRCSSSEGERRIANTLDKMKVAYQSEYSFNDLLGVGGGLLRFDFAILDGEGVVVLLIEYDGEFHYIERPLDNPLEYRQQNDELKNQYCKNNNIPLLRIPYWEFDNIQSIVIKELAKYKIIKEECINGI